MTTVPQNEGVSTNPNPRLSTTMPKEAPEMNTIEHDVEMWRSVAKNLHDYISRTRPPCSCVETEEYIQYRQELANVPTPAERLLYALSNEPDEDRTYETVCESCEMLLQYERRADDVWSDHPDHNTIPEPWLRRKP